MIIKPMQTGAAGLIKTDVGIAQRLDFFDSDFEMSTEHGKHAEIDHRLSTKTIGKVAPAGKTKLIDVAKITATPHPY